MELLLQGVVAMRIVLGLLCISTVFLTACANSHSVTGQANPTAAATQSETAATTSYAGGVNRIVVSYNDETNEQQLITFSQNDRVVNSGASLMGWSYSENGGTSWTYGGKVAPPRYLGRTRMAGWDVLWGDPALTTWGGSYNVVFLSNLAVPSSKFPAGGIHGYFYYGDGKSAYIGGACIAKSTDGGKTFAIYQCVSNKESIPGIPDTPQGHFYDGGSLASNQSGEVFAAYVDVAAGAIDVYRSPSATGIFQPMPPPFPNLVAASHARLRIGPDGSLYVAAQMVGSDGYYIYLNRWVNGNWGNPILASDASVLYPNIDFGTTVQGSDLHLRLGPQFGFDVGAASEGGNDAVRMLYTRTQNNHLYLDASACSADLSSCGRVAGWRVQGGGPGGSAVDSYNPDVTAWRGFIGLPPTWQASWAYHYGNVNSINVSRAALGYANENAFIFPVDMIQNAPVCSDTRGYWGDYDAMLQTGWQNTSSVWMRFSTDSSAGCSKRWTYTGVAQHVQQANYTY
jgi:hypothetical protein